MLFAYYTAGKCTPVLPSLLTRATAAGTPVTSEGGLSPNQASELSQFPRVLEGPLTARFIAGNRWTFGGTMSRVSPCMEPLNRSLHLCLTVPCSVSYLCDRTRRLGGNASIGHSDRNSAVTGGVHIPRTVG